MRTLGLIGGISWISTIDYYRQICVGINEKMGESNYGECIIHSLNYQQVINNNSRGDFDATYRLMLAAGVKLKNSGAEGLVICANTLHMFAAKLEEAVGLPLINSVTATANEINKQGLKKVGLLGTKATMEMDFYKDILKKQGIETIVPEAFDRHYIHEKIFSELGRDIIKMETKAGYINIINKLLRQGAEGIILGCTEIPLLISQNDCSYPLFDTTVIHAKAAVEFALSE
ncbi:MAG TPA: aspartate/glutamate racemase family protein [Bacteroidia bacterium]|jgi:aspartate racemase|nr:aspartate/glutamate racemase family protein [Bacteroidia bacterium]